MTATGCGATVSGSGSGSGSQSGPEVIMAGQVPRSAVLVGGEGGAKSGATTATTVPLAKQDPTTALFTAIGAFQSCLKARGVTFQGAPDPSNPSSPANDPAYLKSLSTCAAQSNIVQALSATTAQQNNLTPKQVAAENKAYLKWRTCMVSRGWGIPVPKPNAKGELFSFGGGGGGGSGGQLTPPPGQSLFTSPDLKICTAQSQSGKS
jgi:hypothetical protein